MYVSVRRYKNVPDPAAFIRDVKIDFLPKLKSMPGFVAYYSVNEGDGCLTTISVFSTTSMAEESNEAAAEWVGHRDPDNVLQPSEVVSGELAIVEPAIRG